MRKRLLTVDTGKFHQYVSENGILSFQIELLYNHNVDIEVFHQYVCENGLLGYIKTIEIIIVEPLVLNVFPKY